MVSGDETGFKNRGEIASCESAASAHCCSTAHLREQKFTVAGKRSLQRSARRQRTRSPPGGCRDRGGTAGGARSAWHARGHPRDAAAALNSAKPRETRQKPIKGMGETSSPSPLAFDFLTRVFGCMLPRSIASAAEQRFWMFSNQCHLEDLLKPPNFYSWAFCVGYGAWQTLHLSAASITAHSAWSLYPLPLSILWALASGYSSPSSTLAIGLQL